MTAQEAADPAQSVPDLLAQALRSAAALSQEVQLAARDITWAYQDLLRDNRLPEISNEPGPAAVGAHLDPPSRDALLAEFATRSILPVKLPLLLDEARRLVETLETLDELVPPLRTGGAVTPTEVTT